VAKAKFSKIAISLPADDLARIERACSQLKMTRSEFMLNAARSWLERAEQQKLVQQYVRGYQAQPENTAHILVVETVQSQLLGEESW
jgi:metal-responsive CopG/Arc/MetJ family transcriptional regulator